MSSAKAYKIVTPRLVIRCYTVADTPLLQKSINESLEHLKPWMPWAWHEPESLEAKTLRVQRFWEDFHTGKDYIFGIFNLAETEVLGSTGLHARVEENAREIGYWVNINHANKGIITEAVKALTKVGFEIEGLNRIEIKCDVDNKISALIPEKCGFVLKEIAKARLKDEKGNDRDAMIWEMTKEHYFQNPFNDIWLTAYDTAGEEIK